MRPAGTTRLAKVAEPLLDAPADLGALRRYLTDRRNIFLLASVGSRTVGFLRGTSLGQVHTRRPQMFLYEVAVAPACRRRGVGRALVEHLLAYCRARRFDEVFVFTDPGNRPAVALYRGTGAITETPRDRMFVYPLRKRAGGGRAPAGRRRGQPLPQRRSNR
ncbi:MAG: GNAT family N-acetyltransferase [Thermoplasmata archaeon]